MSKSLQDILGATMSLETTIWLCENAEGGYFFMDENNIPQGVIPSLSFSEKATGRLGYNPTIDKYMLVDQTINLPVFYFNIDETGQLKVSMPTPAELGVAEKPKDIDVMPFVYDCLKNGLKDIPKQFKEIKKEVKILLRQKYKVNPKEGGFIDWYIKTKLTPFINDNPGLIEIAKYFGARKRLDLITGEVHFHSSNLPTITLKDVQDYCRFQKANFAAYEKSTLLELSSTGTIQVNKIFPTYKWQGPVNDKINQLDDLFDLLNGRYLESSIEVFRSVFGVGPFIQPVNWLGKDSELIWLILELQKHDYLKKTTQQNWQTMVHTFVGANGVLSAGSLKVQKKNLNMNLKEEAKKEISTIVENL